MRILRPIAVRVLAFFARRVLRRYEPTVIAVAGSVGKTTTRQAIFTALTGSFTVWQAQGSLNSEVGLPLAIFGVAEAPASVGDWGRAVGRGLRLLLRRQPYPELLVLEFGEDHPGDIRTLTALAHPTVAVITSTGTAHLAQFGTPEAIQQEMRDLVRSIPAEGFVVLNGDEAITKVLESDSQAPVALVGFSEGCEVRASQVVLELPRPTVDGVGRHHEPRLNATVEIRSEKPNKIVLTGFVAPHQLFSALAAIAVARSFGVEFKEILDRLPRLRPVAGRMRLLPGLRGAWILDDSYNSSPPAVEAAVRVLEKFPGVRRRLAVLGVMAELGPTSAAEHQRIGTLIAGVVDELIVVATPGKGYASAADDYAVGARAGGLEEESIFTVPNATAAGERLQKVLKARDVVLVKGSQVARLEAAIGKVLADPSLASQVLTRQTAFWRQRPVDNSTGIL